MIEYYRLIESNLKSEVYFKENSEFTCHQMMQANMTFFYIRDVVRGTSFLDLFKIKKELRNRNIYYYVEPIPNFSPINKIFPFTALLHRFKNYLIDRLRMI